MAIYPSPVLTVSREAIAANWRLLSARHAKGRCAAVVKANAYGLGMVPVAEYLAREGCATFFVATLAEAVMLRQALPRQEIYVFEGYLKGEENTYETYRLSPVLTTTQQVKRARDREVLPRCALHIDTGMCRLGLNAEEAETVAGLPVALLMTHLACASTPAHPLNVEQLRLFEAARVHFPGIPCSVANSSGMFLDAAFHYDLGRPGCSLYGITPNADQPNPMRQVAELTAPILQIREAARDQTVGYGATAQVKKGQRILTAGIGYADGIHRMASNSEIKAFMGEYALPLLGRVSMDLTCWDATEVPLSLLESAHSVSLINATQPVDRVAEICHTIGYEIFTRLGSRVQRHYEDLP